ncbi:putative phospholipid:diacylglycerol acyltransferase 2 [Arachis stenosperma]|uniref:putative phospholipid:diacylglycerol acyltransferase 2 n=1 Tax=Arachis stenosperma TaxID=217475 RepID=UPI0025AC2610|nr:putative phospholipid:diacylglycerol acyltransferase 2 [Arachis stenosperma]
MDPPGIRVRAVPGLVAADNFVPAYSFWSLLIQNLAKFGYEGKNLYMTSYDWRLSFQNTEEIACDDVWTEHDEMSRESTQKVATEKRT